MTSQAQAEALTGIATLKAGGAEGRVLDHWSRVVYYQWPPGDCGQKNLNHIVPHWDRV